MTKPRILVADVETAPIEAWVWKIWDENVGLDMIKTDWSILSFSAKWLGDKRVMYADTSGRGANKVRDDSILLASLWKLLNQADIVVTQNGKKFDIKKINARLIQAGFGPYSPIRQIDTLQVARKTFGFTSNKLAWVSKILTDAPKSEHKEFPGFELWKACLQDDSKAWKVMKKYNKQDVVSTEKYYLRLRPWIESHPNLGAYFDGSEHSCPACGSANTQKRGITTTQQGRYQRFQCTECGSWSRGKQKLLPSHRSKSLLTTSK